MTNGDIMELGKGKGKEKIKKALSLAIICYHFIPFAIKNRCGFINPMTFVKSI